MELPTKFKALLSDDEDEVQKKVGKLPIAERIEAIVEILLFDSFDYDYLEETLSEATTKMPKTMGAWAKRVAPRLVASSQTLESEVGQAVLYAFVRAGIPIEPAWERLLVLERYNPIARACIEAIPEDRREAAVIAGLRAHGAFVNRHRTGLAILEDFQFPQLVRFLVAETKTALSPKHVQQALAELGKRHPAIAQVLSTKKQKPAPKLTVLERSKPTIKQLDANAKKQVEQSAKRFDERKQSAADLLAGKGDEPLAPFTLVKIADEKGKLAYEAWLHLIDAGSIYKAGTTKLVAQIIQDGLECDDPSLRDALEDVIRAKPARKKR